MFSHSRWKVLCPSKCNNQWTLQWSLRPAVLLHSIYIYHQSDLTDPFHTILFFCYKSTKVKQEKCIIQYTYSVPLVCNGFLYFYGGLPLVADIPLPINLRSQPWTSMIPVLPVLKRLKWSKTPINMVF